MSSITRMVVLVSLLAHLWVGCGCCCAPEAKTKSQAKCAHAHDHAHHEDAPCKTPCQDSHHHPDHGCDFCHYGFIVSVANGTSISSAFEIDQPIPLASDRLSMYAEFSTGPAFNVPSPEAVTCDPRSFRAQIAVFLL